MTTTVAFLGLGAIGAPMARHLPAQGFDLVVWNRTRARADELATSVRARVADTPADAVREANVAITCLPTSREVEEILDGDDGMLVGFRGGATLVDCTSGDPATSRRIATRLHAHDVAFVDAPVSGGRNGAEQGTLTIMCGGDAAVVERVRPVLAAFGKNIVHCGDVGAGDMVKAVNQALLAIHIWATGEGLATLAKSGVDTRVALEVINTSSGRSNTSMNLFPERVMTRAFPRTFRLALLDKDLRIAAGIARDAGVPTPITQLASELFRAARAELGEEADHVEAVRVIERTANVEIGA
ncbi:MAG: NAD(P)-dependent oxidoreductase [Gemmatimonadota bacterium]|nr:NAD(P)-dependent oxidoreductase [Gemmatimonadota bacterium]